MTRESAVGAVDAGLFRFKDAFLLGSFGVPRRLLPSIRDHRATDRRVAGALWHGRGWSSNGVASGGGTIRGLLYGLIGHVAGDTPLWGEP